MDYPKIKMITAAVLCAFAQGALAQVTVINSTGVVAEGSGVVAQSDYSVQLGDGNNLNGGAFSTSNWDGTQFIVTNYTPPASDSNAVIGRSNNLTGIANMQVIGNNNMVTPGALWGYMPAWTSDSSLIGNRNNIQGGSQFVLIGNDSDNTAGYADTVQIGNNTAVIGGITTTYRGMVAIGLGARAQGGVDPNLAGVALGAGSNAAYGTVDIGGRRLTTMGDGQAQGEGMTVRQGNVIATTAAANLNTEVTRIDAQLTSLSATVASGATAAAVAVVETRTTAVEGALVDHETRITTLEASTVSAVAATNGRIDGLATRTTAVEAKNVQQDTAIATAQSTANMARAENAQTSNRVDTLSNKMTAAETMLGQHATQIRTAQDAADQANARVGVVETTVGAQGQSIAGLQARATAIETVNAQQDTAIQATRQEIVATNQVVAGHGQRIGKLETDLQALDNKLLDLDKRMAAGVAMSMAMANVATPQISLKEPSAVGAATGYFQGAPALSVAYVRLIKLSEDGGTIAVRVSGAASAGGMGLGAGVSYSF